MFDVYHTEEASALLQNSGVDFMMKRDEGPMDDVEIRINLNPAEDGIKFEHKSALERTDKQMAIIGTNGKHRGVSRKEAMKVITLMTRCESMLLGGDYVAFYNKNSSFYLEGSTYYVGSMLVMKMQESNGMQPLSKEELQEVLELIRGRTADLRAGSVSFSAFELA